MPNGGVISSSGWMKNPEAKPKLGWRRVDFRGVREGYPRPRELFKSRQKEIERQKAEIREREEKRKRRTEKIKERDRQYSEKLRNGTPEERERERVYQEELKRNGGLVNDSLGVGRPL